jgi:hypothetical protein
MATKVNAIESDRGRSMSAEDDMMFMMGSPFGDVSDIGVVVARLDEIRNYCEGSPRPSCTMTKANLLVDEP